jgi:hypothetical protein
MDDSPQFVVLDSEELAKQKLEELKIDYWHKNKWSFNNSREDYNSRCYWHIRDVPYDGFTADV